jgi:hypothetical protein
MSGDQGRRLLLIDVIRRRAPLLLSSAEALLRGDAVPFEAVDSIRMAIGDEFVEAGIDPATGDVNHEGVELDALIDLVASLERSARGERD